MIRINPFQMKKKTYRTSFQDSFARKHIREHILSFIPPYPRDYVVVCIGTDRSTGDSLGPLAGSLLATRKLQNIHIYGTLHNPVHALNLEDYIIKIKKDYQNPFIIAIDACLGRKQSVGDLIVGKGPLKPGAALQKKLPEIGNIYITGVVNVGGFMEHSILQSTRLALVMDMAKEIANCLTTLDIELTTSQNRHPFVKENINLL